MSTSHENDTVMTQGNDATTRYEGCTFRKKFTGTVVLTKESISFVGSSPSAPKSEWPWTDLAKHQVSPASHPKPLLKLLLRPPQSGGPTITMANRTDLERIRRDVTDRLAHLKATSREQAQSSSTGSHSDRLPSPKTPPASGNYTDMDSTSLTVSRSSLLASSPSLRAQHDFLVPSVLSEEDFWQTHLAEQTDEYARIRGKTKGGTSSVIRSSLDLSKGGRIRLGVEEMRQIFVLYPAVHKAYEEKVPLELSENQFWRKYLESEFFHRDRGRIGAHIGRALQQQQQQPLSKDGSAHSTGDDKEASEEKKDEKSAEEQKEEETNARVAAVGTDDMFSRYDTELQKKKKRDSNVVGSNKKARLSTQLAVGQFDLAATANTERGSRLLLEGGRDLFPLPDDNSKAERVIDKYNRHWAMVLNPDEATAGCDLHQIARRSVQQVGGSSEEDAKVGGGVTDEMRRLVGFASADADHADHVHGRGAGAGSDDVDNDALFDELTLHNIEGYSGTIQTGASSEEAIQAACQRRALFSKSLMDKLRIATTSSTNSTPLASSIFPNPKLGRELLSALTLKMEADARTDADAIRLAHGLPEQFLEDLSKYFRRTCELLRHFFGLRQLQGGQQKLHKIVGGMEVVYRNMEAMRKELPQSEAGERMRKMCKPIMDQLDWAFQLNRGDLGRSGGGGFVTVEEL